MYFNLMLSAISRPKVSVLMAVKNGESYLPYSIESILKQTFFDFEFLITDDGSTDAGPAIIESFHDPRIRLIRNSRNLGVAESINRAMDTARGDYVARMDADDISYPQRLQNQVEFLDKNPDISLCGSWIRCFEGRREVFRYPTDPESIKLDLLFDNPIAQPSVMFRLADFKSHGLYYNPLQRYTEDYDLWARAAESLRLANLPEVLLLYRIHPFQQTRVREEIRLKENITIMDRQLRLIGLVPSEQDLAIHSEIASGRMPSSAESLKAMENYFKRLLMANSVSRHFFPKLLHKRLASYYFRALGHILRQNRLSLTAFSPIALSPVLPLSRKLNAMRKFISNELQKLIQGVCFQAGRLKGLVDSRRKENNSSIFFFFPYRCVGGADRVHADIVRSIGDKRPWICFTDIAPDKGFEPLFSRNATLHDISQKTRKPRGRAFCLGYWSRFIEKHHNATLFGCNSSFYYDLINVLRTKPRLLDLIHAFSPGGMENYSLPYVARLENGS